MREGSELPKAIRDAPVLLPGLAMYLTAYYRLDTCRSASFGSIGNISWVAIMDYCDRLEIFDEEQREDMEHHISVLDSAYQEWAEGQRKSKSGRNR